MPIHSFLTRFLHERQEIGKQEKELWSLWEGQPNVISLKMHVRPALHFSNERYLSAAIAHSK